MSARGPGIRMDRLVLVTRATDVGGAGYWTTEKSALEEHKRPLQYWHAHESAIAAHAGDSGGRYFNRRLES